MITLENGLRALLISDLRPGQVASSITAQQSESNGDHADKFSSNYEADILVGKKRSSCRADSESDKDSDAESVELEADIDNEEETVRKRRTFLANQIQNEKLVSFSLNFDLHFMILKFL